MTCPYRKAGKGQILHFRLLLSFINLMLRTLVCSVVSEDTEVMVSSKTNSVFGTASLKVSSAIIVVKRAYSCWLVTFAAASGYREIMMHNNRNSCQHQLNTYSVLSPFPASVRAKIVLSQLPCKWGKGGHLIAQPQLGVCSKKQQLSRKK